MQFLSYVNDFTGVLPMKGFLIFVSSHLRVIALDHLLGKMSVGVYETLS